MSEARGDRHLRTLGRGRLLLELIDLVSTESHEEFRSSAEVADQPAMALEEKDLVDESRRCRIKDLVGNGTKRNGILANMFYC